jgi:hypothetical protein
VLVFHHFAVLRTGGACSLVAENAQPFSVIRIFFSMQITKALNSDESLGKESYELHNFKQYRYRLLISNCLFAAKAKHKIGRCAKSSAGV